MAFKGLKTAVEKAGSGIKMIKIKPGGNCTIRWFFPLDDVVSVYEHTLKNGDRYHSFTCPGKEVGCPECLKGKYPTMRSYIPVIDDTDDQVKVWKVSKGVAETIVTLDSEYEKEGGLIGKQTKWTRTGETNRPTYSPISTKAGAKLDIPDLITKIPDLERLTEVKPTQTIIEEIEAFYGGTVPADTNSDSGSSNSGGGDNAENNQKADGDDDYPF